MPAIPVLPAATLEAISDVLGDTSDGLTGPEIARLLRDSELAHVREQFATALTANLRWKAREDEA